MPAGQRREVVVEDTPRCGRCLVDQLERAGYGVVGAKAAVAGLLG